jgi:uncharacterized protein
MPDPFEALRTAPTPIDPDAAFAARLRARVARALNPDAEGEQTMTLQTSDATERVRQGDMSHLSLWVRDARRAAAFYSAVLGWQVTPAEDGSLVEGLAISHGLTDLQAIEEYLTQVGLRLAGPLEPTASPVFVVDDIRAALERVRELGGQVSSIDERPYGLVATAVDDQGMVFGLNQSPAGGAPLRSPAFASRAGDVAYVSIEAVDDARARAFYGSVLGLQFTPGRAEHGWNIAEIAPMSGLSGGHARPGVVVMYRVDDIARAVQRVRELGGTATEPLTQPYGITADCVDDQGTRFYLGQF